MYKDKTNVDVLLFLEHKDRELEVIASLAKRLRNEHNMSVAIASSVFDRITTAFSVRPKVAVIPSFSVMTPMYWNIYGPDLTFIDLNWEQMLSTFNKKYRTPRFELAKEMVKHCAWGTSYRDFLIEKGIKKENIYITGRPATSLLIRKATSSREIRSMVAKKGKIDAKKKWAFFPMCCLHAFFDDSHVRSFVSKNLSLEMAFARRDYVSKTLDMMIKWFDAAEEHCNQNGILLVIRPHPAVSIDQYKERFLQIVGRIPRHIHFSKELTAQEWLIGCDACYTNYSSLALDAYTIKRPAFLLEPAPFPGFLGYEWFRCFSKITKFEELLDSFETLSGQEYGGLDSEHRKLAATVFDDEHDGINETVSLLARLVRQSKNRPRQSYPSIIKETCRDYRQSLGSLIRQIGMKANLRSLVRPGLRNDYFSAEEIRKRLE